jgi:hypothetical protein
MVASEIDNNFMAHLVLFGDQPRIPVTLVVDGKELVIEGVQRRCYDKNKRLLCIELLKRESTRACPIIEFGARGCLSDAFSRLARTGEPFATILHPDWEDPAFVWSLWPNSDWAE